MGFYERITGEQEPGLPIHNIRALLAEHERGKLTLAEVSAHLGLSPAEEVEAQALLAKVIHPRECIPIGGRFVATNIGTAYITLGAALIQQAGITQIQFGVRVQKVGTGTQSWRLFNVTDNEELALIDDAAAAGAEKNLSVTVNFSPGRSPGMKVFLVQGKSTVGADDPIFCGSAISVRRFDILTGVELEDISLIASQHNADGQPGPYSSAATQLKPRFGVS